MVFVANGVQLNRSSDDSTTICEFVGPLKSNPNWFERRPKLPLSTIILGAVGTCNRLSRNQLVPLNCPAETRPRARISEPGCTRTPVNCQPPEIRVPFPKSVQTLPSVEFWKLVRHTSGDEPPRSQVIVEPTYVRLCVAGEVFCKR